MKRATIRSRYRLPAGTVIVAIAITTTGCHVEQPYTPAPSTAASQASADLKSLPSFEDTKSQLLAAIDEITTATSQKIPDAVSETATNADSGSCPAPYDQSDGQSAYLPNRIAENIAVSEQQWTDLLEVAKTSAAKFGATDSQVMQDQPGKHNVWFSGPAGAFIKFSYKGNMVVSGYTGCRLPQNKK